MGGSNSVVIGTTGGFGGGSADAGMGEYNPGDFSEGMEVDGGGGFQPMTSWPFVAGITALTLVVSVGLGLLFAKRKVKKGLELYED